MSIVRFIFYLPAFAVSNAFFRPCKMSRDWHRSGTITTGGMQKFSAPRLFVDLLVPNTFTTFLFVLIFTMFLIGVQIGMFILF